ncbi:hypothetical protein KC19_VG157300 [Ceratodon purpureus]|uniref:Uncharacterized protein n=1 Tax=Ceratodon purpureus TaxID=3225 RepID=A0A8T0HQF6_CERPU|nr:hypothetical protein KC19_VG157300 [Ceratodon purpureus]
MTVSVQAVLSIRHKNYASETIWQDCRVGGKNLWQNISDKHKLESLIYAGCRIRHYPSQ